MRFPTSFLFSALFALDSTVTDTGKPDDLYACLKGFDLIKPSDPKYMEEKAAYNRRLSFDPIAIVFPRSAVDVSDIVKCSTKNSFKVTARSGGHSYAAYGIGGQDGNVIVDLRHLNGVFVNADNTAVAGTGNRIGDLASGILKWDRGLPHGTCPYVGSGGHTAFGGYGLASRKYGLLIDTVVSAQVVLADGSIITADETNNADVFWAIRGSAASFGIVTSFTFRTFAAQDSIGFTINWPNRTLNETEFVSALMAYQDLSLYVSKELGLKGSMKGGLGKQVALSFLGFWWGNPSEFEPMIKPFLAKLPYGYQFSPKTYSYISALIFLSGKGTIDTTLPDKPDTFFVKNLVTKKPHTSTELQSLTEYLYTNGVNSTTSWSIGLELYGGGDSLISQVSSEATAFPSRDAFINYKFTASSGNNTFPPDGITFLAKMLDSLEPNVAAAYAGYVDPTLSGAQWQSQYYGSNYARLLKIKQDRDPQNVFDFPQSIGR